MEIQNLIKNLTAYRSLDYLITKAEEAVESMNPQHEGSFGMYSNLYELTKNPKYLEKMKKKVFDLGICENPFYHYLKLYEITKEKDWLERVRRFNNKMWENWKWGIDAEVEGLIKIYEVSKDNKDIETAKELARNYNSEDAIKRKSVIEAFLHIYDITKDKNDLKEARDRLNKLKWLKIDPIQTKTIANLSTEIYTRSGAGILSTKKAKEKSKKMMGESKKYENTLPDSTKEPTNYCLAYLDNLEKLVVDNGNLNNFLNDSFNSFVNAFKSSNDPLANENIKRRLTGIFAKHKFFGSASELAENIFHPFYRFYAFYSIAKEMLKNKKELVN